MLFVRIRQSSKTHSAFCVNVMKICFAFAVTMLLFLSACEQADPPQANMSLSRKSGNVPLSVTATDFSSGEIDSREWLISDGRVIQNEKNPTIIFDNPGSFDITLVVEGPGGIDEDMETISVRGEVAEVSNFRLENIRELDLIRLSMDIEIVSDEQQSYVWGLAWFIFRVETNEWSNMVMEDTSCPNITEFNIFGHLDSIEGNRPQTIVRNYPYRCFPNQRNGTEYVGAWYAYDRREPGQVGFPTQPFDRRVPPEDRSVLPGFTWPP